VRQRMKNLSVLGERLRLPSGRLSHATQSAHAHLLMIVSLITIQRYFDHGAIPTVTRSLTPFIVAAWAIGVILLLCRDSFPTLCFYVLFVGFACFLELTNFGAPRLVNSWLVLAGLILAIELVAIGTMRSLPRIFQTVFSILYRVAISSVLLGVLCYNLRFNASISGQTSQALLQTTLFEVREFLSVYVDARSVLVVTAALLIIIACGVAQHRLREAGIPGRAIVAIAIVALTQFAYLYRPSKLDIATFGYVYTYYTELAALRTIVAARQKSLPSIGAHKTAKGETYVLVIGESQNKDHMSLYGYSRKTTPWIDEQICRPNWVSFNHAYSNYVQTVPALSLSLTAASQYNGKAYTSSPSILDVAKAAGFRTFWLSNQQGLGAWNNPITAIAETADVYIKINSNIGKSLAADYYDSKLIEKFDQLKDQIHSGDNNLIVFHLMGSHGDYCSRYPQSFAKFGDAKAKKSKAFYNVLLSGNEEVRRREIDCYDNSIAFTDYVLSQVFAEAKQLPGFRAFVYLPDHAEAVDAGLMHDPQRFTFAMTHISLLVWLSDAFMTSEPDRAKALHQHENSVWTNDLLDDLLVGLSGIDVKNHDPSYDLSSNSYRLDWNSALTLHGARKLRDDPRFLSASAADSPGTTSNSLCEPHLATSSIRKLAKYPWRSPRRRS
jgi:heptose-I-phosphate ethanolaminephosphotransferase